MSFTEVYMTEYIRYKMAYYTFHTFDKYNSCIVYKFHALQKFTQNAI